MRYGLIISLTMIGIGSVAEAQTHRENEKPLSLTSGPEPSNSPSQTAVRPSLFGSGRIALLDEVGDEQEPVKELPPQEWTFQLTPYLWMAGISTNATVGGNSSTMDASFIDLVQDLRMGGMLHFEARKQRWGVMFDGLYMKLVDDRSARIGPFKLQGVSIDGQLETMIAETHLFYRIPVDKSHVDLFGGMRYLSIEMNVDVGPFRTIGGRRDLFDPVVGARTQIPLSENWALSLRGDVGGFDVGSHFSWNATAILGYKINETASFLMGYRHFDIDIRKKNFEIDMQMSGPIIGLQFTF